MACMLEHFINFRNECSIGKKNLVNQYFISLVLVWPLVRNTIDSEHIIKNFHCVSQYSC